MTIDTGGEFQSRLTLSGVRRTLNFLAARRIIIQQRVSLHEEAGLALDDSELVERTRLAANEVCEKAKLALRPLLPGVEALQKDNTHFSPRLMLLMLSRAGEKLALQDRERLEHILVHAEAFQPQLITWMSSVRDKTAGTGSPADGAKCADAIQLMTKHLADLDVLLDKVGGERRTS